MTRNLDRRVEVVAPVLDPQLKKYLKDTVLAAYLRDNVKASVMNSDGKLRACHRWNRRRAVQQPVVFRRCKQFTASAVFIR